MYGSFVLENSIEYEKTEILFRKERGFSMAKKRKEIRLEELTEEEKMKYEIAEELGLLDKVMAEGWRSLSSKETGKIGGLVSKRRRNVEK